MSRFFSHRYSGLVPYVPGEQPRDRRYIKLNTNESPYPPSPGVEAAVRGECANLQLYSDPESYDLRCAMAERYGVDPDCVVMTNGSDEVLNLAFMAFADEAHPLLFPDITYGFYAVFAEVNHIPYRTLPLDEQFRIRLQDYLPGNETVVLANPNAPTGIALTRAEIERLVAANPDRIVIVDEAYVDFGGESAVSLTERYPNLLVTGTFSKSRSMAGARLGFGFAQKALIADLNTLRYATNPYNVNRMTAAAGRAALREDTYYRQNCQTVIATRERTRTALEALGFYVLPSSANFLFARCDRIGGGELYEKLKESGILVRHFTAPRIAAFNRITVGKPEDMQTLVETIRQILEAKA